jgi:beta-xylosidase/AraC-like DNA-binding protein
MWGGEMDTDTSKVTIYRLSRSLSRQVPGIELFFIMEGRARLQDGNTVHHLGEGDVLLLERRGQIRISPEPPLLDKDCILLSLRVSPGFLSFAFEGDIPAFVCDSAAGARQDYTALRSILAEIACCRGENTLLFRSRLFRLLRELKENFSISEDTSSGTNENTEKKREARIAGYIQKNFRNPLTLEELAEEFSLTPQYLSRYFKKQFSVNFHAYLNRLRLENAMKDLVLSDNTVTVIAYDNGFPNLSSFLKELKDVTGKTPTEYRRVADTKEQKPETGETGKEEMDSTVIQDKLRPYLTTENNQLFQNNLLVEVDVNQGVSFERPWSEVINLGFAHDFFKSVFLDQIKLLQQEASFRYGRFQGLFGKSMHISNASNNEYNFVRPDRIIDFLYSIRLIPFIELGFKPDMISDEVGKLVFINNEEVESLPIEDYEILLDRFIRHAVNRYGIQEVSKWRFEFMAPTAGSIRLSYTAAELDIYLEQYTRIRKVIKRIAPAALLGGPGFNLTSPELFNVMAKILHVLEERNCPPDFFSFYDSSLSEFSLDSEIQTVAIQEDKPLILWGKGEQTKRINWAKELITSLFPQIQCFYVTEWNLDFSCRNRIHDSLLKAPFVLQNSIDAIGNIDVLAYWLASDISSEYSDPGAILIGGAGLFGGAGLISRHGIRKPPFFTYQFLSRLGSMLLAKGQGYIVTQKSEIEYAAIVFNYKYISNQSRIRNDYRALPQNPDEFLEGTERLLVSLYLNNIQPGRYKVRQHILNKHHGSVYDAWKSLSSVDELTSEEASWLEQTCVPSIQIDFVTGTSGQLSLKYDLEPNEVRFLEINRILE